MTKFTIFTALAFVVGLSVSGGELTAQIQDELNTPAEFPPASYTARQYVDSRGCVYIRAGIDGNVTWVPRVARNRKVVCGFQPTLSATTRRAAAPAAEPKPEVVEFAPAASPASAKPRVVAAPAAAPKTIVQKTTVRKKPVPKTSVRKVAQAPQTAPLAVVRTPVASAPVKKAVTVQAPIAGNATTVRSGQTPPVKVYAGKSSATYITDQTRVAPKDAYVRGASTAVPVPKGYKPAFDDGRLSTTRAHGTLDGRRRMLLIWTNTVPRRLIDKYTGEEVSSYFPGLQYPYTTRRAQHAAGVVSTRGEVPAAAPKPQVQSKIVRRAAPEQAASHRFVKVGNFSTLAKAREATRRLQAAGLPVQINAVTHRGQDYKTVLAGPFKTQSQLRAALDTVRHRIGYQTAALRK